MNLWTVFGLYAHVCLIETYWRRGQLGGAGCVVLFLLSFLRIGYCAVYFFFDALLYGFDLCFARTVFTVSGARKYAIELWMDAAFALSGVPRQFGSG